MKNLHLADWTVNKLLGGLEGERVKPNWDDAIFPTVVAPSVRLTNDYPTARPSSEVAAGPKPNTGSNLPAATEAAPSSPVDVGVDLKSALLKAIVEPDIYTAPVDRDRAIMFRWVLRDIKGNRLKWSPVNQHDRQDLIDMGLVEMRNDAPVLTNLGVSAID